MQKILWAALLSVAMAVPAMADAKFEKFVESLWPRVHAAGFERSLFDAAFKGITEPDPVVI